MNPSHAWQRGAKILGAQLSSCRDCGTLRVEEGDHVHYIRRASTERVLLDAPACVRPAASPAPW